MITAFCILLPPLVSSFNQGWKDEAAYKYPVNRTKDWDEDKRACWLQEKRHHTMYVFRSRAKCKYLYGTAVMDEGQQQATVGYLKNVTGCYIFKNLEALIGVTLEGVKRMRANYDLCKYKYSLMIYGNYDLHQVGTKGIDILPEEVFIKANPKLHKENVQSDFPIDIGTDQDCTMDMARISNRCVNIVGDLELNMNFSTKKVLSRTKKIYGTITIQNLAADSLKILKNVKTLDGWASPVISIMNNSKLVDISQLLDIDVTGPKPIYYFKNNTRLCHNIEVVKKLEEKIGMKLEWTKACLEHCKGGLVNQAYLAGLSAFCNEIDGNLDIQRLENLPEGIEKLKQIEKINGRLTVTDNTGVRDLSFLRNLKEINNTDESKPTVVVKRNTNFVMDGMVNLKKIHGNISLEADEDAVPTRTKEKIERSSDGDIVVSESKKVNPGLIIGIIVGILILIILIAIIGFVIVKVVIKPKKKGTADEKTKSKSMSMSNATSPKPDDVKAADKPEKKSETPETDKKTI